MHLEENIPLRGGVVVVVLAEGVLRGGVVVVVLEEGVLRGSSCRGASCTFSNNNNQNTQYDEQIKRKLWTT